MPRRASWVVTVFVSLNPHQSFDIPASILWAFRFDGAHFLPPQSIHWVCKSPPTTPFEDHHLTTIFTASSVTWNDLSNRLTLLIKSPWDTASSLVLKPLLWSGAGLLLNSAAIKDTRGDGDMKMLLLQCIPLIRVHPFQQQRVLLPNSPSRRSLNSDRSVRRFYSAVNVPLIHALAEDHHRRCIWLKAAVNYADWVWKSDGNSAGCRILFLFLHPLWSVGWWWIQGLLMSQSVGHSCGRCVCTR